METNLAINARRGLAARTAYIRHYLSQYLTEQQLLARDVRTARELRSANSKILRQSMNLAVDDYPLVNTAALWDWKWHETVHILHKRERRRLSFKPLYKKDWIEIKQIISNQTYLRKVT